MNNPPDGAEKNVWEKRFVILLFAGVFVRLILALSLDLTPDEAYYWEFSRRLDLSYFDHPPFVGYLIALSRLFFGDTEIAIRLPAIAGIAFLSWAMFKVGRDTLGSARTGFFAAALLHLTPAGVALGFITTPDVPLALFWTLSTMAFLRILESDTTWNWLLLGLALGLGAASKYNMILFCPAVAASLLIFPNRRAAVGSGRFWLMFGLAFLGALPVILWNHQHDWASIRFQLHHGFKPGRLSFFGTLGEFLGGQAVTIGPVLFGVIWWVVISRLRKGWKEADEKRVFLAGAALVTMTFFAYRGIQSKVEANWPQVAYLSAMLLVGEWIGEGNIKRKVCCVIGPSALLASLAVLHALTLIIPLPPGSDVATRLHGWVDLGRAIQRIDKDTDFRQVFVGQGAPLTALAAFYGKLPPNRIMEAHGTGNWKFWWTAGALPAGSGIVYVDEYKYSEAAAYTPQFMGPNASETHRIMFLGREIRKINLTILKNSRNQFIFK